MAIMIGEHYKVESDKLNIILYSNFPVDLAQSERTLKLLRERWGENMKVKDPSTKWEVEGYFSTVRNLLTYLSNLELNKTDFKDMEIICERMDNIYKLIERSCPDITVNGLREL
jgi:hypothetical protein